MMTLINSRTSKGLKRWVTLREDGTAVGCILAQPMNVSIVNGKQKIERLPEKVTERVIPFKDMEELRKIAYQFVRNGTTKLPKDEPPPIPASTETP